MSSVDPHDLRASVGRWLAQQSEAGQRRVWIDAEVMREAAEAASRPATEPRSEPDPLHKSEPTPAAEVSDVTAPESAKSSPENPSLDRAIVPIDAEARKRKAAALADLDASQVSVCTKCALSKSRTNTVFGVGNPDADLVFVGEAPGADEDRRGEPFVGRAGQLLTKIIEAIGFAREDVFIANVLKCRPPDNRDPAADEVLHCEPYLIRQLEIIEPKVICALGRVSAQTLLQTRMSLTKMRANVHDYHGIPLIATYHPAALLRNPNWKRPTWEDVRKLRAMYDSLTSESH